jgi:hypothetical protein
MTHHISLEGIHLDVGNHPEEGRGCVMNWVARFAGEKVTDHPVCTSPVLTAFAIAFNDGVDQAPRDRLVPFIPRLVGTSGDPEADAVRVWLATDWLVRVFAPAWLRKAGLTAEADSLLALPELTSVELARSAQPIIDAANAKARAAWDAPGAAARDAARDAAGDAARAAAWGAAPETKGGYSVKYAAARKAADDILKPLYAETIIELRESALTLFDRMIDVKVGVPA